MKTRIWYGLEVWLVLVEGNVYGVYTSAEAADSVVEELSNKKWPIPARISCERRRVYS